MSKFSKKSLAILLTIAFVLTTVVLPASAKTTYSRETAPRVSDDTENAKLGTISIEIDPIVTDEHEAWVELPKDFKVNRVEVTKAVYKAVYDGAAEVMINGEPVAVGTGEDFGAKPEDQGFVLKIKTPIDAENVEVRLVFADVKVPKGASGAIKATFENLKGQLVDGEEIIGYASGGALNLAVRESENFADKGKVTIRVTEATAGTLKKGKALKVKLPRGFEWDHIDGYTPEDLVFGDDEALEEVKYSISDDGRTLTIEFKFKDGKDKTGVRTAFDVSGRIKVSNLVRANKGDVVATVSGDYTTSPEELLVGVYGDYDFDIEAGEPKTVYAGRVKQAIADITISEEIAGTFIGGRYVILELPDWAKWGTLPKTPEGKDVHLDFVGFYGTDGRTARYEVKCDDEEQSAKPEEIKLKDMEIVLAPEAPVGEDVVVKISGSAGVRGEVVVGKVAAPAELKVDEVKVIGIGRTNQEIGTITITEAKAGMFRAGEKLILKLDEDVAWERTPEVKVVEGDLEIGSVVTYGSEDLYISIKEESDKPSTIEVKGAVRTLRTVPEGETFVVLTGTAVVETIDKDRLDDQWELDDDDDVWYYVHKGTDKYRVVRKDNVFPNENAVAEAVLAKVGVPAPEIAPETRVDFTIGSTTYVVNNQTKVMDAAPFIEDGRTYIPVRALAEALGCEADWEPKEGLTEKVYLTRGDVVVTIGIGDNFLTVQEGDDEPVIQYFDGAAKIVNDRTFLPFRAVAEALGAKVDYAPKPGPVTHVWFEQ